MSKTAGILPAPSHVQYNSQSLTGWLQMMWEPPTLLRSELSHINVEPRIIQYVLIIATEETVMVHNISETSFNFELLDNSSCSLSFKVAAVNPAGMGEFSPPQDVDCKLQAGILECVVCSHQIYIIYVSSVLFKMPVHLSSL